MFARSNPVRRFRAGIAVLALALAGGCGDQIQGPSGTTNVTIRDNQFSPQTVIIARGSTVRWSNNGSNIHTSVSDGGHWSSGNLSPAQTHSHTFANSGTFPYRCTLHPGMTGTVIVD
jgi:plastocyanin